MADCSKFFSKFRPQVHIPLIIGGVILIAGLAFLFGFIVMLLWNWLMPDIFELGKITYWQAWGLVILAHILFKSFPGAHDHDRNKKHHKKGFKAEFKKKMKEAFDKECDKEESSKPEDVTVEETDRSSTEQEEVSSTWNEKDGE